MVMFDIFHGLKACSQARGSSPNSDNDGGDDDDDDDDNSSNSNNIRIFRIAIKIIFNILF
jgi:hypothetical protein